ncbi:MAG: hypothetical protein HZC46_05900 [Ignavibacterium album]|uniref:hypothetical protein n=1 Tax=Ignavibacterium album TaxID=591197 RepID=UPI0026F32A1D|nr:hypothetical protein [Ignavibacterium album]MBI5661658.1 hypothetical protein [Ignavibacterium album]
MQKVLLHLYLFFHIPYFLFNIIPTPIYRRRNLFALSLYKALGNEIVTLVDEYREAGRYKLEFDASSLASGVYIYKLTAGELLFAPLEC